MKENLPLITTIASSLAVLFSIIFGYNQQVIYAIIILFLLLLGFLYIIYSSENKKENVRIGDIDYMPRIINLITNNLNQKAPNGIKKYLSVESQLLVVGFDEKQTSDIKEEIQKEFEDLKESIDVRSIFVNEEKDEEEIKSELVTKLNKSNAVLIIRTIKLEENSWVYEIVTEWAKNNSHSPCLTIDLLSKSDESDLRKSNKYNVLPNYFYHINYEPISAIPWRLLKRADDRALAWRKQAGFNRSFALVFFGSLLPLSILSVFSYITTKNDRTIATKTFSDQILNMYDYTAKESLENYSAKTEINISDYDLNLSIWQRSDSIIWQLGGTESLSEKCFQDNNESLVGCVINNADNIVFWSKSLETNDPIVFNYDGNVINRWDSDQEKINIGKTFCNYYQVSHLTYKQVICLSFKRNSNCAICIDSKKEGKNLSSEISRQILHELAMRFTSHMEKTNFSINLKELECNQ